MQFHLLCLLLPFLNQNGATLHKSFATFLSYSSHLSNVSRMELGRTKLSPRRGNHIHNPSVSEAFAELSGAYSESGSSAFHQELKERGSKKNYSCSPHSPWMLPQHSRKRGACPVRYKSNQSSTISCQLV